MGVFRRVCQRDKKDSTGARVLGLDGRSGFFWVAVEDVYESEELLVSRNLNHQHKDGRHAVTVFQLPNTLAMLIADSAVRLFSSMILATNVDSIGIALIVISSANGDQFSTIVFEPFSITRYSACHRTARDKTDASTSRPIATMSSAVVACVTRRMSCSIIGPSSRSAVT